MRDASLSNETSSANTTDDYFKKKIYIIAYQNILGGAQSERDSSCGALVVRLSSSV